MFRSIVAVCRDSSIIKNRALARGRTWRGPVGQVLGPLDNACGQGYDRLGSPQTWISPVDSSEPVRCNWQLKSYDGPRKPQVFFARATLKTVIRTRFQSRPLPIGEN